MSRVSGGDALPRIQQYHIICKDSPIIFLSLLCITLQWCHTNKQTIEMLFGFECSAENWRFVAEQFKEKLADKVVVHCMYAHLNWCCSCSLLNVMQLKLK
jgi:hypothetical protein